MADVLVNYAQQAKDLAKQEGIANATLSNIIQKAQNNEAMIKPTDSKQAVYDLYQQHYSQLVKDKALQGQQLTAPNAWKQEVYDEFGQSHLISQNAFEDRLQQGSQEHLSSMEKWLQQMSQSQKDSQASQLGLARDQQLAEIDKALNEAVNKGQISIRDAEEQYKQAEQQILQQAYNDSEATNLAGYGRGIQNSAQMVGLMQGDQARRNSLLNQNVTTRDQQINAINNQLEQLRYNANIDKSMANVNYNYGLAGAEANIDANMMQQLLQVNQSERDRIANQLFQSGQSAREQQMAQQFTKENMAIQQQYQLDQMKQQQTFDLQKLSKQQQYTLEQMAKSFGYDLQKMDKTQQYTLAQMAQSFGYDMQLQSSQQQFQAGQNALDRNTQVMLQQMSQNHDLSMLNEQQRLQLDQYNIELDRKLAGFTPGSPEYKLLQAEADWAYSQVVREQQANYATEIGYSELTNALKSYPTQLPDPSDKKAVEKYNSQVSAVNARIQKLLGKEGEKYLRDKAKAKGKSESETNSFINGLKGLSKSIPTMSNITNSALKYANGVFTP